jgi:hypothetical protein
LGENLKENFHLLKYRKCKKKQNARPEIKKMKLKTGNARQEIKKMKLKTGNARQEMKNETQNWKCKTGNARAEINETQNRKCKQRRIPSLCSVVG